MYVDDVVALAAAVDDDDSLSGVDVVVLVLMRCRYSLMLNRGRFFGSNFPLAFKRVDFVVVF